MVLIVDSLYGLNIFIWPTSAYGYEIKVKNEQVFLETLEIENT